MQILYKKYWGISKRILNKFWKKPRTSFVMEFLEKGERTVREFFEGFLVLPLNGLIDKNSIKKYYFREKIFWRNQCRNFRKNILEECLKKSLKKKSGEIESFRNNPSPRRTGEPSAQVFLQEFHDKKTFWKRQTANPEFTSERIYERISESFFQESPEQFLEEFPKKDWRILTWNSWSNRFGRLVEKYPAKSLEKLESFLEKYQGIILSLRFSWRHIWLYKGIPAGIPTKFKLRIFKIINWSNFGRILSS